MSTVPTPDASHRGQIEENRVPPVDPSMTHARTVWEGTRRSYLGELAKFLVSSGMDRQTVGDLLAELDDHLAATGTNPVAELGPVGKLAQDLTAASEERKPMRILGARLLFWLSVGFATMAFFALLPFGADSGPAEIEPILLLIFAGFGCAQDIAWWNATRDTEGTNEFIKPSRVKSSIALMFVVGIALVVSVALGASGQSLTWSVPLSVAWTLLVASVVVTMFSAVVLYRLEWVRVPGNARHLRGLGWTVLNR